MSLAAVRTAPLNGLPELPCYRWQGRAADPTELLSVAELAAEHLGIGPAVAPRRRPAPAAQRLAVMDAASAPVPLPHVPSRVFVTGGTLATRRTPAKRRTPTRRNRCRTCGYLLIAPGHAIICGETS